MRRTILLILFAITASGCGFGASASVNLGPKFNSEGTSWALTLEFAPVMYLEPDGLPSGRYAGEAEASSAYAPGLSMRAFSTVGLDGSDFSLAPGLGVGFNPYMLLRPEGQPFFDAHLGMQFARSFGGSNGLELGPHISMSFRTFDASGYAGMIGVGADCLIAENGPGCGPIAKFKLMRTGSFEP